MVGNEDRDAKYWLSDGRDARELLDEIDAMLRRGDEPAARRFHRKELLRRSDDDKETLLYAANERWRLTPRAPMSLTVPDLREGVLFALKNDVAYPGPIESVTLAVVDVVATAFTWGGLGVLPDVRDARTMAEQFLGRVEQLMCLPDATLDGTVSRARNEVLQGVPKSYRRKVVERVLDAEEALLREKGADEALETVEQERPARRERAWQALVEGEGPTSRRQR